MSSHDFHLCQNGALSCGACCGAYTRAGERPHQLAARLEARGRDFDTSVDVSRPETLSAYRERHARPAALPEMPLRDCAFLGRLHESGRVGCLLHPARGGPMDGVRFDARDAGAYDRITCATFRCAAYTRWSPSEQRLIAGACGEDSVLYGWVLNDFALLEPFFHAVRARTRSGDGLERFPESPEAARALSRFVQLKRDWIYRDDELILMGQVLPQVEDAVPLEPTHTVILEALGSAFDDTDMEAEAVAIVEACIVSAARVVDALTAQRRPGGG